MGPALETPDLLLIDLDGTLIDVNMQHFIPGWLSGIASLLPDQGQADDFPRKARLAIRALLEEGDGRSTNAGRFFTNMTQHGGDPLALRQVIERYCHDGMHDLAHLVRPVGGAKKLLRFARGAGLKLVLATNPVFPVSAIRARLEWAGLDDSCFDLVTHWDNCRHCKPDKGYFLDILDHFGVCPQRALMVGNDTGHDMAAVRAGLKTFLVDTHLVERQPAWPADWRGGLDDLCRFLGGDSGIF